MIRCRARRLSRIASATRASLTSLVSLPLNTLEAKPGAHWQSLFRDVDIVRNTLSGASAVLLADLPFALLFLGIIFVVAPAIVIFGPGAARRCAVVRPTDLSFPKNNWKRPKTFTMNFAAGT